MKIKTYLILLAGIATFASCSKEDEESTYLEPIAILLPTTNQTFVTKGDPINYKVKFTTDNYIDSIHVFFQIDSFLQGYKKLNDSIIRRDTFSSTEKANIKTIEGTYQPLVFPPVGKKMYMTFRFYRLINIYKDPKKDSTDKILTIQVQ